MGLRGDLVAVGIAGAVIVAAGYIASKKIKGAAVAAAPLVDPTSDKNLAYTGVNKVGAALTGQQDFRLGTWIYDLLHPGENFSSTPIPQLSIEERLKRYDMGGADFGVSPEASANWVW